MSTYHGSLPNAGNDEHRYKGQVASNVDVGNSTSLESYVSTENDTILTVLQNVWSSVKSGTDAISEKVDNGEILMALTTEESTKLNAALDLMTEVATLNRQCLSIFQAGGVANSDLAVLKAEVQAYASDAGNISTGVLAVANGGTGRTDGMVTDVSLGTGVTAVGTGQIGEAVVKTSINANTLTTAGTYLCRSNTLANNWPTTTTGFVEVTKNGVDIRQKYFAGNNVFERYSSNTGSTWSGWIPKVNDAGAKNTIKVYVSKNGDDTNSGLDSTKPVLTLDRACEILAGYKAYTMYLCVDSGNWGSYRFNNPFNCIYFYITKFDGIISTTAVDNMPYFSKLDVYKQVATVIIGNLEIDDFRFDGANVCEFQGYNKLGSSTTYNGGSLFLNSNVYMVIYSRSNITRQVFGASYKGMVFIHAGVTIEIAAGVKNIQFLYSDFYGNFCVRNVTFVNAANFTGKKYELRRGAIYEGETDIESLPGTTGTVGSNVIINGIPKFDVVLTSGDQEVGGNFSPSASNTYNLGAANQYWKDAYVGSSSPIAHSDERIKSSITHIPDEVLDAWGEVQWAQYQFNDAIEKKGVDARLHTGIVAQRIKSIFEAKGLDAFRYGLLCYDSWEAKEWEETVVDKEAVIGMMTVVDSPAYTDYEGIKHPAMTHEEEKVLEQEVSHIEHHHEDAGNIYGIRYSEALAMEAAYQRRRADRIEARLAALEAKVK